MVVKRVSEVWPAKTSRVSSLKQPRLYLSAPVGCRPYVVHHLEASYAASVPKASGRPFWLYKRTGCSVYVETISCRMFLSVKYSTIINASTATPVKMST